MAGYVNNPPSNQTPVTHYVNNPTSNATPVTNYANSPVGGVPLPPAGALLWYDGNNTDGLGNTTRIDGVAFTPWKNLGSTTGADVAHAAGATWRAVAAAGKLNNLPAVSGDGTQYLTSPVLAPTIAQPLTYGMVFMSVDVTGTEVWFQGSDAGLNQHQFAHIGGANIWLNAGTFVDTGVPLQSGKWHLLTIEVDGASSIMRLDGVASGPYNIGTNILGGVALFAQAAGAFKLTGRIAEFVCYPKATISAANLDNYFRDKYGTAFPQ